MLLAAPFTPEFVIAYFGIRCSGGIVVSINTMSTRLETEYLLTDAECGLAVP